MENLSENSKVAIGVVAGITYMAIMGILLSWSQILFPIVFTVFTAVVTYRIINGKDYDKSYISGVLILSFIILCKAVGLVTVIGTGIILAIPIGILVVLWNKKDKEGFWTFSAFFVPFVAFVIFIVDSIPTDEEQFAIESSEQVARHQKQKAYSESHGETYEMPPPMEYSVWLAKKEAAKVSRRNAKPKAKHKTASSSNNVDSQFSAWSGKHIDFARRVKNSFHDPSSFEHVETRYEERGGNLIVGMKCRGKNAFGATLTKYYIGTYTKSGSFISYREDK